MNRRSRAPEARGIPGFPTSCIESAQRELNPHIRHGKATGCRYIMGAWLEAELSKIQEHREGLEPSSPHYGCGVLATGRPVPVLVWKPERETQSERPFKPSSRRPSSAEVGPVGIEPTPYGLRVRRAACYTTPPEGDRAYAFVASRQHRVSPFVFAVVSGSDQSGIHADRCPNRTQHNAVISRVWTTSPTKKPGAVCDTGS